MYVLPEHMPSVLKLLVPASASTFVLSQVVPHLVKMFLDPVEIPSRGPILLLLSEIILATYDNTPNTVPPDQSRLLEFKDDLITIIRAGMQAPASMVAALTTLKNMVSIEHFWSPDELAILIHDVNHLLSPEFEGPPDARYCDYPIVDPRSL